MPSRERRAANGTEGDDEGGGMLNGVAGAASRNQASRPFREGLSKLSQRSADARRRVSGWSGVIVRETRAHPGRSVALALGAGYILGGGLFTALTARLVGAAVRIGIRVAVVPLVTDGIAALGGGFLGPEPDAGEEQQGAHAAQH